jgi:hypothetical protein
VVTTAPMPPELTRYAFHFALSVRKHGLIVRRLLDFVGRPWLRQKRLKLFEIIGADRATLAAQHDESHGSIELRHLRRRQGARDLLGQTKARNAPPLAVALFHVVVDLYLPIPERDRAW